MTLEIIDFDNIDEWAKSLEDALHPWMTDFAKRKLAESKLQYVEDTRDLLFKLTNKDKVIGAVLDWLGSKKIAGYHGTRITEAESISIKSNGLLPLIVANRCNRLNRALSSHHKWNEVVKDLDEVIKSHGQGNREGKREGQTHLTLSMAGLIYGFNHYLVYGSEFDQRVAQKLLGQDGMELLSHDGESKVIKVAIPGDLALQAAHPFFSIEKVRGDDEVPNLVNEFLQAWSYRVSNPNFQSSQLKVDCGMIFWKTVPADWIVDIKTVEIPFNQRVY
jgi:hypothetical protein